jgi:hypothetical protein
VGFGKRQSSPPLLWKVEGGFCKGTRRALLSKADADECVRNAKAIFDHILAARDVTADDFSEILCHCALPMAALMVAWAEAE